MLGGRGWVIATTKLAGRWRHGRPPAPSGSKQLPVHGFPVASNLLVMSLEFFLTSLIVVLVPGTGVVYTVSSSIGGGLRRGLVAAFGCTLGIVPHLIAAMFGLSGIMQAGATVFEIVRWAGVVYLVFMGLSMIRRGGAATLDGDRTSESDGFGAIVRRGVLLNLLNPKLTLFFFAFLPQFIEAPSGVVDLDLIVLGGVFMVITLLVFAVYAYASSAVRDRILRSPAVVTWIERSLGALLIGFAVKLAVTDS